jgi:hypothetical protein
MAQSSMTALYVIANQYLELAAKLDSLDLDTQTIVDTIDASGIEDEFSLKAQGILHIASEAEKYTPMIDMEIERLQALKAGRAKLAQGLRDYLLDNMERSGIQKITCPLFSLSIRHNPPSVEVLDRAALPLSYWRTPEPRPPVAAPDKAAIKAALQSGVDVPGAKLTQSLKLVIK